MNILESAPFLTFSVFSVGVDWYNFFCYSFLIRLEEFDKVQVTSMSLQVFCLQMLPTLLEIYSWWGAVRDHPARCLVWRFVWRCLWIQMKTRLRNSAQLQNGGQLLMSSRHGEISYSIDIGSQRRRSFADRVPAFSLVTRSTEQWPYEAVVTIQASTLD